MPPITETRFRVRYAETDQMGVVYYSNYLVWMEVGRVEWCRQRGCNYREMERDSGILLAVADSSMLASGATRHLILDREFRRTRLPEKYFAMFGLKK